MNKGRHLRNTVAARRALVQCAPIITGSTIDPLDLSRCALSKEIISEDVDKKVKDRQKAKFDRLCSKVTKCMYNSSPFGAVGRHKFFIRHVFL